MWRQRIQLLLFTAHLLTMPTQVFGLSFDIPAPGTDMVGDIQHTYVQAGDSILSLSRRYNVGYYELVEANPGVDPDMLEIGQRLTIPSRYILPRQFRDGIVVNLAEMRVYYYDNKLHKVYTYPAAIGRDGWETPVGTKTITEKRENPVWIVPESVRTARAKEGVLLPEKVMPGPDNPLGKYALRLNHSTLLIHGTNDITVIGRRETAGCLRLYPEDIKVLFDKVNVGTPVHIIDQPVKLGLKDNKLYLEAHVPLVAIFNSQYANDTTPVMTEVTQFSRQQHMGVQWHKAMAVASERSGLPQVIGSRRPDQQP